ncbi:MAG: saccharopine dehydrogenase NADP-binding domain-containing protein [Deltaproteobacteria bacterium]
MEREGREFDVVLWGATGFTGALVAEHFFRRFGADGGELRWALGGRSQAKLEAVRASLGEGAAALPLLVGDAANAGDMGRIAGQARVVCSTVGPYAKYGTPLVSACVAAGTDYCDLTGEPQWMARMIEAHEEAAVASGARIVHTCGFDCIPADLGTFFVQREMKARFGMASPHVKMRVKGLSGGASGGTLASMVFMMEEAAKDPSVTRVMTEPYSLNPQGARSGPDSAERLTPWFDAEFGQWSAPFMMAAIDTKVVRRSNALTDYAYGRNFRYDEGVLMGTGPLGALKAGATAFGQGGVMAAASIGPLRRLAAGRMPAPGEGPSREAREKGFFDLRFHALHPQDAALSLRTRVTGDMDPGYGSTSKMLGESAACLAKDVLPKRGGFFTPAALMAEPLLERLVQHAGLTFEVEA